MINLFEQLYVFFTYLAFQKDGVITLKDTEEPQKKKRSYSLSLDKLHTV